MPWLSIAPLGRPVVPPVYCSSATSSAEIDGHCAGLGRAFDECLEGDDPRIVRNRDVRIADRAPVVVLADDQPIEQPLGEKLQRHRQQRGEIAGDQNARAAIAELVRQRDLAIERLKMHHARAGLQRAEEIHRMIRRIAEEQRDRGVLAAARAQERRGRGLDPVFQLGIADRPVAEFDRGPRAEIGRRLRHQVRQRAARDRIVPANAFRIEFFAGMGHAELRHSGARPLARTRNP